MSRKKVKSREYKLMLRKDLFAGNEQQLLRVASTFWYAFEQVVSNIVVNVSGNLKTVTDRRRIKFFDTNQHVLYSNYYILRERCDIDGNKREVTLKFRHPDRYLSQDRSMKASDPNKEKMKFEEDIKPPFTVLYSFSTTQEIPCDENLSYLQDVSGLYPDLSNELTPYIKGAEIEPVGATIKELVLKGANFQIRNDPQLDSECALIFWYILDGDQEQPVAVEFSFRYGNKNEDYTQKVAQRAYDVFQALQEKLASWVDHESQTKTAYIYS